MRNTKELKIEKILKSKEKLSKEFTLEVSKMHKIFQKIINKYNSEAKPESLSSSKKYRYIQNYDWDNVKNVLELYKESSIPLAKDKYIHSKRFDIDNECSISKLYSLIAEWLFGSYSRWWTLDINNKNERLFNLSKIKCRHVQIQYLIENMILDQKK